MLPEILPEAAVFVLSGMGAGLKIREAILGLRASARLHNVVEAQAHQDSDLRRLMEIAAQHKMDIAEFADACQRLEQLAGSLSKADRQLVMEGLRQPSRGGTRRYVTDVLTSAA